MLVSSDEDDAHPKSTAFLASLLANVKLNPSYIGQVTLVYASYYVGNTLNYFHKSKLNSINFHYI